MREKYNEHLVATWVFIACLVFIGIIYAVDIFIGKETEALYTGDILEIVKTLAFTICGYLFGRVRNTQNSNEN